MLIFYVYFANLKTYVNLVIHYMFPLCNDHEIAS